MTRLSTDKLMGFRLVSSMGPEAGITTPSALGDKLGIKTGLKNGASKDDDEPR